MKFKLDENTPLILKRIIESHGNHNVESVYYEKIPGISDKELLSKCLQEKRVLITIDKDFTNDLLYPKESYHGIIILHSLKKKKSNCNAI